MEAEPGTCHCIEPGTWNPEGTRRRIPHCITALRKPPTTCETPVHDQVTLVKSKRESACSQLSSHRQHAHVMVLSHLANDIATVAWLLNGLLRGMQEMQSGGSDWMDWRWRDRRARDRRENLYPQAQV